MSERDSQVISRELAIDILVHNCKVMEIQNGKKGFCEGFIND